MPIDFAGHWFVMIFGPGLLIGMLPKAANGSFRADDVTYTSVDANYLTSFCDRLLDQQGQLAGIQISPISESAHYLMRAVQHAAYVTTEPGAFQVWLSEAPMADAQNNAEQAFGGQVFRSQTGDFALSIDADFLFAPTDEVQLLYAHATWAKITTDE